ncbi:hypothetical protein EZS27_026901 [termite gut metagenome]|uniref:Uncharacterized protein n=1 Tax=termite gut metagenome TaxID=433724 RepID=A0A5J4QS26_9ZZZZ
MSIIMDKRITACIKASCIIFTFLAASCSSGGDYPFYSYNDPTIYSTSDKVMPTEIILFISPYIEYNGQKKYIVADNLRNLLLKVNKKSWQLTDSYVMDTLHLSGKETVGRYRVTNQKLSYPFAVDIKVATGELATAGQYAELLNNYLSLRPGSYICRIESLDIKTAAGALEKIYTPTLICPLDINENCASVNLGSFEILIE